MHIRRYIYQLLIARNLLFWVGFVLGLFVLLLWFDTAVVIGYCIITIARQSHLRSSAGVNMNFSYLFCILVSLSWVNAATHTFNWTTGWTLANPDGVFERPVISCNGEFPWPDIRVQKGDRVLVYLTNGFNDTQTSMHFHGLFQNGNNQMDGVPLLTQCPIGPGQTFLYNFTVESNSGAYWYHSHTEAQYEDGMRGAFIIDDGENNENYPYEYDEEVVLSLSEWYHDNVATLLPQFLSIFNPTGAEPIPQNLIINDTRNLSWEVRPDTTYLLRIINLGGFVSQYFWIEDHEFDVVEVDGITVERNTTNMIYITSAQRYTVLLHTRNDTSRNYAIMQKFDDTMLDVIPDDLELNATSSLTYNTSAPLAEQSYVDSIDDFLDDFYLVPLSRDALLPEPDIRITLDVAMDNLVTGINYAFFNNITYVAPLVPALATVLSAGENATNPEIYGSNTHSFVLDEDDVVEIVLNNLDTGKHPFHLHGHVFQTIIRDRTYDDAIGEVPVPFNESDHAEYPQYPMLRDVLYVNPQSNFVIRFRADNPGVWFFHCHIEWHLAQGLAIVLVEDPLGIQANSSQELTASSQAVCNAINMPITGNAVGNSTDFFNLAGEPVQPNTIPTGFTAKGIVAMVFSCLAGVLGLITITIYGLMEQTHVEEDFIEDMMIDPATVLEEDDPSNSNTAEKSGAEPTVREY